jgi:hypothetical protein
MAALFAFAGVMKLVPPSEALAAQSPLPVLFIRLIGVAEVLGAVGLILPAALRIRAELTPLAAACLAVIMAGAAVLTAATGALGGAVVPLSSGALSA